MMIERLHITCFKGFHDFTLDCRQFTCLVGFNNSGKTSILQALQLFYDIFAFAFGRGERPDFGTPAWTSNPSVGLTRLGYADLDVAWLRKRTSETCKITVVLSENVEVQLGILGRRKYELDVLKDGTSIKTSMEDPEARRVVESIFDLRLVNVPPVGAVSPAENFITWPQLDSEINAGRLPLNWRASLFWNYELGRKESFQEVAAAIGEYLPGATLLLPRLDRSNPARFSIEYEEDQTVFDISTSGGGLRTLLTLASVLRLSDSRCFLFDEPDSHLHSSLQRRVADMLLTHSSEKNVQVFVATHSPDFLAAIPVEALLWVDRNEQEGKPCSEIGRVLVDLGAITSADAIRACGADKILLVEGSLDRQVLAALFALSDHKDPFADETVIIATLPHGKGDVVHVRLFQQLLQETLSLAMRVACLTDNDYDLQETSGDAPGDEEQVLLLRLERKEVENYFLEPKVLAKAGELSSRKRHERSGGAVNFPSAEETGQRLAGVLGSAEVRNIVRYQVLPRYRETLDPHLARATKEEKAETWFEQSWQDNDWKLRNCPGKKVLRSLRAWFQKEFGLTLTDRTLLEALKESEGCPDDIRQLAKTVEEFFYGGEVQDPEPQSEEEGSDEVGSCA